MKWIQSSIIIVSLTFLATCLAETNDSDCVAKEKFKEMKGKFKEMNKKKKMYQKKYQELKKKSDTRPCPDSVVLNDSNVKDELLENSSDKEANRCYDTSLVTNMTNLFFSFSDFNADLSSWDVSSVIEMAVSYQV